MKISNFLANSVQLIQEDGDKEAFASVVLNPLLTWIKFILTDDEANENKVRIPKDEFANIIKTGLFMPVKMAFGQIEEGHDESFAIGVITHLKEVGNKVMGLAALWNRERKEDIELIKQRYAENEPLDLSWEIVYEDSRFEEDGTEVLLGVVLRATTLVTSPAYAGRTIITEVASKKDDNIQEEKILDELKDLQTKHEKLIAEEAKLASKVEELEARITELQENQVTDEMKAELKELRTFKAERDAEVEKAEKVTAIRQKFVDGGLDKDDEYFSTNEEMLLGLSDEMLEFLVGEVASAGTEETDEDNSEDSSTKIPNVKKAKKLKEDLTPKEMAEQYRKIAAKKERK